MIKNEIKRRLSALSLALVMTLGGCGTYESSKSNSDGTSNDTSSSLEAVYNEETSEEIDFSKEMIEEVKSLEDSSIAVTYKTSDYSLITINGNTYLTKETISTDGYCLNHKYYDVNNNELVGQYNEINFTESDYYSNRLALYEGKTHYYGKDKFDKYVKVNGISCYGYFDKYTYDINLHDDMYFNGNYGYGVNISKQSIWPISHFVSSEYFTKDEFNYFNSNSESLHKHLMNDYYVVESLNIMDKAVLRCYLYHEYGIFYNELDGVGVANYYKQPLQKFTCTKDDETNSFIGYRCSYNENDIAYNYAYNYFTWEYIYIGKNKLDAFDSVKIEDIGNKKHKTTAQFMELLNATKKDSVTNETSKVEENNNLAEENETLNENQNPEVIEETKEVQNKIKASSLIIIDTSNAIFVGGTQEIVDDYYILLFKEKDKDTGIDRYTNLYNDYENWDVIIDKMHKYSNALHISSDNQTVLMFLNYDFESKKEVDGVEFFNDLLAKKELTNLIKDEYTKEEINEIYASLKEPQKQLVL